jgi:AcrR family transcriptional regulator
MPRTADPQARIFLLRAAQEVFSEKGLERTKVEEITGKAGLSKGAFYLHFESKEEAFLHVAEGFLARCSSMFETPEQTSVASRGVLSAPEGGRKLLAYWLEQDEGMFEFLWQSRGFVKLLNTCQGEHQYLLETFHGGIRKGVTQWVEFCKAEGLYRLDLQAELAATIAFGAYNELSCHILRAAKKPPLRAWLQEAQYTFIRAFGTPALIAIAETMHKEASASHTEALQSSRNLLRGEAESHATPSRTRTAARRPTRPRALAAKYELNKP